MKTEKPTLVDSGKAYELSGLVHRVVQPTGFGPHPTVVMLHGRLGNEDVMWIFGNKLPANWLVVAPRALKASPEGGYVWHYRQRDEWPDLDQFDEGVTAVVRFIHSLRRLYNADLNNIYLMGFSQGAATSYATAMSHPGLVQGIAGLVGFVPVNSDAALAVKPLADVPIFMAVGTKDPLIPYERSQLCAQTLRQAQVQLDYHEYDTGHKLNAQGMRDLKAWWEVQAARLSL